MFFVVDKQTYLFLVSEAVTVSLWTEYHNSCLKGCLLMHFNICTEGGVCVGVLGNGFCFVLVFLLSGFFCLFCFGVVCFLGFFFVWSGFVLCFLAFFFWIFLPSSFYFSLDLLSESEIM